ncbi:MAG: GAF domain-containing sensor histidine kinase [Nonlabens sp.]
MIVAQKTANEDARIHALQSLKILDTITEQQYDNITELASYICKTPIALISLVDSNRQWFKSKVGMELCQTGREESFCSHAILDKDNLMIVPDARLDPRFEGNPLVINGSSNVIFYAGMPIKDEHGNALGTLCVIANEPRELSENKKKALQNLGKQVEELLKMHALNSKLKESKKHLKKHNELLKDFAGTVSHDMKMPLANLIVTSDLLNKKYEDILDSAGRKYLGYLKKSSLSLSEYINSILDHYESSSYELDDRTDFDLNDLLENIIELINIKHDCEINLPEINASLHCNRVALEQIFLNLIGNSIKYNDKQLTVVDVNISITSSHYIFTVQDNGRGIPNEKIDTIFDLFSVVGENDRDGRRGHGIGLSTVKQLVTALGGDISVESQLGHMSRFTFSIAM